MKKDFKKTELNHPEADISIGDKFYRFGKNYDGEYVLKTFTISGRQEIYMDCKYDYFEYEEESLYPYASYPASKIEGVCSKDINDGVYRTPEQALICIYDWHQFYIKKKTQPKETETFDKITQCSDYLTLLPNCPEVHL